MSQDTERIPIPSNGTGPMPPIAPTVPATDRRGATATVVPRDQTVGFTPNQLAAGFGIVAGLLLLLVGARRRRGGK